MNIMHLSKKDINPIKVISKTLVIKTNLLINSYINNNRSIIINSNIFNTFHK